MKRFYIIAVMCLVALMGLKPTLQAQTVWDGTADVTWYDASQTSFDISTPEQLAGLAQLVNTGTSFNGVSLNLTNDIWLNNTGDSTNNWTPIGGGSPTSESPSTGNAFKGNFNGHGHAIYNLYCDKGSTFHAGLFCALENPCTIDSLVMVNPVLKSRGMMGCIAGYPRGSSSVYVRYCLVINARIEGMNTSGSNNIGCIFGATYPNNGSTYVENCGATGSITGYYPGGMSGNAERSYTTNFYFAGTLYAYGTNYGGVAAHGGSFTNCYSYTQVLSSTSQSSASSDGTPVTQTEMQSANMITLLGDAFKEDNGINNGYPIMSYMAGVDPVAVSICQGETVTLTAFGYDSYLWNNGATSESITVSPTTTTTYSVTGTLNGVSATHTSTVTVFPQAVITATVVPSADGQTHGTVTPETSTVPCGSSQTVTLTITPDVNWHISRIVQDGVVLREDDPTDGSVVNFTIDPQGTLANVQVYFDNLYNITVSQQLDDGSPISLSNLVSPWGTNGVYAATAGNDLTYTFTSSDRYHVTDVEIDGVSQGVISSYTFYGVDQTHSILVTYADSCGIFSLPYAEDFSNGFSECWYKGSTYSSTYPYISSSRLYFYTSSSTYTYAVLPAVADDLPYQVNELQVTFNAQYSTLNNMLQVGVMSDPTDASTFMTVGAVSNTATGTMQPHIVYLGTYNGFGKFIAFRWSGTSSGSCYLDDVVVDVAPTCSNVTDLQVTNIYGTNATLTWTPNAMGDAVNYVIEVSEPGDVVATEYFTTEPSYLLTGLSEQTSYTVSVYPDCGGNDYGAPMTVSFTTPCVAPIEAVNNSYPTSTYSTEGNHFPMSNHYLNSFTEQIYLPSELNNVSADFSGMSFQYNDGQVITRTLDIYMAHTYDSAFVQNVWATPSDSYVHVYSGPVTFNNTGTDRWVDIAFDTNFYYNGYDNLLLIVNDITGSTVSNSNAKFYTINYSTNRSQCEYNNDTDANWSITNLPATGRVKTQVNNIRLTACDAVGCITPNTLTVGMTDASSGEISWYNPNASSTCEVEYKAVTDADWTSTGTVNGSSYTIYGLDANTQYQVRVRALCGSASTSEWSETVTFRTECEAIVTLPYVQNFDTDTYGSGTEAYIYCWDRYTTDPSKPVQMYPTSAAHSTPNAIRFYDGANVTNIAIMPKVDESINLYELQVDFYVRSTSSTAPVILELGVMTDKSDPTTFEILDTIPAPYLPNNEYTLVEYSLANYTGYGHYIAFRASNGNGGNNLRLDDVTLNYIPMCQHPVNLAVDAVTSDEVTFHWSEVGGASAWYVEYGPAGFTPGEGTVENAYDTSYTLYGLNPNTQYDVYVWSDCGGLESTSITTTFRTDCGPIVELPYTEDFETGLYNTGMYNDGSVNQQRYVLCWDRLASNNSHHVYIANSTTYSHTGAYYMDFHWTPSCYNIAITPELDQSFDVSQLMVNFWACKSGSAGMLEVGVMTDKTADSTFVPIDTIDLSAMANYAYAEQFVKFNNYTGNGKYIAFRVSNATSSGYYIDDLTIDYAPACSPVSNLEISDISGTSAVVTWEPGHFGTVDSYTLEYSEGGQDNWVTVDNLTATTYLLGNLNFSTYYDVRVKTTCSDGTDGDWVMETFRTNCLVGGDVTVGDGTSTNSYLPSYSFYKYSCTQQLFLASEMGEPKSLESVTFDMANFTVDRTYKIYLMHTNETSISSWIDVSNAQLVFDAQQSLHAGLNTFQFSTPFMYNGSDNLVLIVFDNTGSYSSGNTWRSHTAFSNASRYIYQDASAYSISTVPASAGTGSSNRNNVIFGSPCDSTTTCVAPHLSISSITSDGATVNWVPGYMESAWEMEYRPLSDTNWVSMGSVYSMAEVITGLNPNTPYKVRLRSDCGGGEYSYWAETSFTTACGAFTVTQDNPWTEDFENNTTMTCFDIPVTYTNSSGNTYPKMLLNYSLAAHSGGNSVEFKGDSNMLLLPDFTNDIHDLRMSFWATTWGTTTTAVVGVLSDVNDPSSFEVLGDAGTPGPRGPNGSTGNGNYMGPFDFNGVQANSGRIAILFTGVTSSDAGWNLDDFTVELIPSCPAPAHTSVTVSNVTANSADVSFTDENATHNAWVIYYGETGTPTDNWSSVNVTSTFNTLTGLSSNTNYSLYVVTLCNGVPGDDQTNTVNFSTTTVPAVLPYTTDFEDAVEAQQWVFVNGTQANKWYIGAPMIDAGDVNTTVGGTNGLYISNDGGSSNTYSSTTSKVYAYRDIFVPDGTTELVLSFDWKAQGANSHYHFLRVYWLDPSVNLTPGNNPPGYDLSGQPGGEHWLAGQSTWQHQEMVISADQFVGMGVGDRTYRLAFHWRNESYSVTNPPAAVDNIELRAITCATPTGLYASNVGENGATVSWSGNADTYGVTITSPMGTDYQTTSSNSLTLTGLNPSTTYQVTVRAYCGADSSMISQTYSFTTACGAISVATTPWTTDFEGTDAELLNCWVPATTGYYNGNTFPHITNASTIAHSGTRALEIAFGDIVTALPLFLENLSDLQVSFWAKHNNYSSDNPTMELGYVTDPYDANSFVSLETLTSSTYTQVTRTFADLAALNLPSTTRIAFRYTRPTSSSLSSWYVDDMVVEYIGGSGPVVTDPTVATNAAENVMQTTATLKATITNPDGVTITAKGFQWKTTTGGTYTSVTGTGTGNTFTANLTNLAPNTSYTYKAFITYNGTTVEGSEMTFTTLPEDTPEPCNTPTGLTVSEVTDMSITITWDADANVSSWNIQYSAAGGTLNSATSTTNSYTITGLTPETTYSIQVQANCGNGNLSEWTSAVTGTTTVGIDSWLAGSVTLFPNPAREYIDIRVDGDLNVTMMEVYDVYGKLINTVNVIDNPTRINVSSLANGMYFVRVTTEAGAVTKTFVKKG
jgi:hypothetical protein